MEKVLVINPLPPYATLCHVLYHKEITSACIEFEYWNVAKFTWGETHSNLHGVAAIPQRIFNSMEELQEALDHEDPDKTLIIVQAWTSPAFFRISSEIKKRNFITSVFWAEPLPTSEDQETQNNKNSFRGIIKKNLKKIIRLCGQRNTEQSSPTVPDIVFAAGMAAAKKFSWNKIVPCNYADYELWLSRKSLPINPLYRDKCVFLDEAFCMHPDTQIVYGLQSPDAAGCSAYYSAMKHLFDKIEQEFSLPVIVAAHPKAQYMGNEFGNRPIIHGDTLECLRGAKLVASHTSTTSALAAMSGIPILFVKNSITDRYPFMAPFIHSWSSALGSAIIDANNIPDSLEQHCQINFEKYDSYLNKHMTWAQYKNSPSAPDLISFIKNLNRQ